MNRIIQLTSSGRNGHALFAISGGRISVRLSRGAATDLSYGRQPVGRVLFRTEPRRGERFPQNLSPLRGSLSHWPENPRACARGYDLDRKTVVWGTSVERG